MKLIQKCIFYLILILVFILNSYFSVFHLNFSIFPYIAIAAYIHAFSYILCFIRKYVKKYVKNDCWRSKAMDGTFVWLSLKWCAFIRNGQNAGIRNEISLFHARKKVCQTKAPFFPFSFFAFFWIVLHTVEPRCGHTVARPLK